MDRDPGPLSPADAVPPCAAGTVRITGVAGVALVAIAAILGLFALALGDSTALALDPARVILVLVGAVTVGSALSMRADLWWVWGMSAVGSFLAVFGLPDRWDSFQLLFTMIAVVAAVGAVLCVVGKTWRFAVISALILFHFTGIFMATTSPPTSPWLTDQLFRRVFNPYLQFVYLRNAYHFYSPEPGPASVLAYCLKTEMGKDPATGQRKYNTQWVVLPTRPTNIRDPMGLSYYRILSLNEQLARGTHTLGYMTSDQFEKTEMRVRRVTRTTIPMHPVEPEVMQYKLPSSDVVRYLLPSYASHVILENTPDPETAAKTTVKIYRLEHRNLQAEQMADINQPPYHPSTYRPFFLGEFNVLGKLTDPQEPMLYWMVPIIPRKAPPGDPNPKDYKDYLSMHALGKDRIEDVLAQDEAKGEVFNWSKLR